MAKQYILTVSDSGDIVIEKVTGKPNGDESLYKEVEELRSRVSGLLQDGKHKDDLLFDYIRENIELKRKLKKVKECATSMSNMVNALEIGLGK